MSETDGKINWFEVPASDVKRAEGFYALVFGWSFAPFDDTGEYQMTQDGGGAIYGDAEKKGIRVYFSTGDLDGSITKIRGAGGQSDEPQQIPNMGRYAHCTDTEGNEFGLYQAG